MMARSSAAMRPDSTSAFDSAIYAPTPAPQTTLCRLARKGEGAGVQEGNAQGRNAQVGRTIMATHWQAEAPPTRAAALMILRGLDMLLSGCADPDPADISTCQMTTVTLKDLLRRRDAMMQSGHVLRAAMIEINQDIVTLLRRVGLLAENVLLQCAWMESLRSRGLSEDSLRNFVDVARRVAADREIDFHQAVLRTVRNQPVKITKAQAQAIGLVADLLEARQQWKRIAVPPLAHLCLPSCLPRPSA